MNARYIELSCQSPRGSYYRACTVVGPAKFLLGEIISLTTPKFVNLAQ